MYVQCLWLGMELYFCRIDCTLKIEQSGILWPGSHWFFQEDQLFVYYMVLISLHYIYFPIIYVHNSAMQNSKVVSIFSNALYFSKSKYLLFYFINSQFFNLFFFHLFLFFFLLFIHSLSDTSLVLCMQWMQEIVLATSLGRIIK